MLQPIIYHSFEEKAQLETELMAKIPLQRRRAAWKAITELFANATPIRKSQPKSKKLKRPRQ